MKNMLRFRYLVGLAAAALIIVSCRGKADYRDVLPADAFMTVSLNPASLLEKSGVGTLEQCPLYTQIAPQIEQDATLTAEEKEYLLGLLKNPAETGFDLEKDLYYFMSMGGTSNAPEISGGLLLPVRDKAELERLMERINAKSGIEPRHEEGLTLAVVGDTNPMRALYAYNDDALLLYFAQNPSLDLAAEAKALFAQKRDASLMGLPSLADMLSRKNDVNMVLSYAHIMSLMADDASMNMLPATILDALRNMTVVASTNFEKGRIVMKSKTIAADQEGEAKIRELYAYAQPQTGALLPFIPSGSLGVLGCGLDGSKLFALLAQIPGYGAMLANPQVKGVMDALKGDFAIAFSGMAASRGEQYPLATLLAQVTDPAIVQNLVANLQGMPLRQTGEGAYTFEFGGIDNRFGVKDNMLYITTDPTVIAAIDGTAIESMSVLERLFNGQNGTLYVNVEGVTNLLTPLVGMHPQSGTILSVLGLFQTLEVNGTAQEGTGIINMTNKEQNALKSVCDGVSALVGACPTEANE